MPKKKYHVTLTDEERTQLEQLLRGGKVAARKVTRARLLLKAADGWPDQRIAEALSSGSPKPSQSDVPRLSAPASASSRKASRRWMNAHVPATRRSWMRKPKPD